MMPRNLVLTVTYDGSHFLGWQKTAMGKSVEGELQKSLEQILQHPISLQAASRTDAGVHARGQVVNFFTTKGKLNLQALLRSINALLPPDVAVTHLEEKPNDFHPTLHATCKEYRYYLQLGAIYDPCDRYYRWHVPYSLNLDHMHHAAEFFQGKHDFAAFCNVRKGKRYEDFSREITSLEIIEEEPTKLMLRVVGGNFLYKMVRNLVGTIVYVGCGKILLRELPEILSKKDRRLAGVTAPAHGLTLHQVWYSGHPFQKYHDSTSQNSHAKA